MKIVLVTGGTGFMGRHLVRRLVGKGIKLKILGIKRRQAVFCNNEIEFVEADLKNPTSLRGVCDGVDVVFHIAGEKRKRKNFYPVNVKGTENILNEAVASRVRRFVYMSSVGVIGPGRERLVNEATPCHPSNEYEKSKWLGEKLVLKYSVQNGLSIIILRPTNIFGDEDPEMGLLNLIKSIRNDKFFFIGKGDAVVNYIYAGQVARICLEVCRVEQETNQIYHIAAPLSLRDFVGLIAEVLNKKIPERCLPLPLAYGTGFCAEIVNKLFTGNPIPLDLNKVQALCNQRAYSGEKVEKEFDINLREGLKEGLLNTIQYYQKKGLV